MRKIILLILVMIISNVSYAKLSCSNKLFIENKQFNINSKIYKFISYFCEDKNNDEEEFFSKTAMLEVQAENINKLYKNVIGIWGMLNIELEAWNDKPALHYFMPATESIEADIPIMIKNNELMVQCVYINQRLKNFMEAKYSYCGDQQIIEDGFGEDAILNLFPEFYLYSIYHNIYFPETNKYLSDKQFDAFIGKIDDINFYRRYSSLNDYFLNKFIVIMVNKEKEYHFKESKIYQRILGKTKSEGIIGLDIIDAKGNITFYDKKILLELLNKSTIKPNIKSYIQQEKINLYNNPNENEPESMYLVQNDFVKILDVIWDKDQYSNVWFKVSYISKKHGEIIKWIRGYAFNPWNYGEG
ncbi:hypothetical protein A9G24_05010 [Gilliamella sp. App6-5]|uniref:hypothetical protein n=1 Tax=Gilliamella sp. App6-5 TaxID=3120232 RepID=UPI00080E9C14|nr:hypothetical protein [Gilliamella apicola]OCG16115.1 hypothetical protein A9G24_05010 [Gilliamella apicola]